MQPAPLFPRDEAACSTCTAAAAPRPRLVLEFPLSVAQHRPEPAAGSFAINAASCAAVRGWGDLPSCSPEKQSRDRSGSWLSKPRGGGAVGPCRAMWHSERALRACEPEGVSVCDQTLRESRLGSEPRESESALSVRVREPESRFRTAPFALVRAAGAHALPLPFCTLAPHLRGGVAGGLVLRSVWTPFP